MKDLVENKQDLFKGQVLSIGIDTHKKNFRVNIRNNGRELKKFVMDTDPVKLHNFLNTNYPGATINSAYEAGFNGFWLHRELKKYGINNIVVNPADIPCTEKERSMKTDKRDSAKIARELENQSLTGIYIPSQREESFRNISRLRVQIVKENVRIKNRIKSFLALFNIKLPENSELNHWSKNFIAVIKNIKFQEDNDRIVRDNLVTELEHQRKRNKEILLIIKEMNKGIEVIKYLRTVPGIGPIIAFTLYAELYKIERFPRLDDLCSIIGLVPSVRESSENKYNLGLTHRSNNILRSLIIEASWKAVSCDPALTAAFNQYCKRMSKQKAIIRIARKLISRIRYVWCNKKEYVPTVIK